MKKHKTSGAVHDYLAGIGSQGGKAGKKADKRRAANTRWANHKPHTQRPA